MNYLLSTLASPGSHFSLLKLFSGINKFFLRLTITEFLPAAGRGETLAENGYIS